ncbi:kinase-like protein [Aspergillus campestris IBT 28561]|uniref:non-specific serine/threonine protein kinase n=1 Tax=Aspergillus campestris (strain IBT 28561) TaxID=1392248 RepID=A0A2I1D8K3_ASPC2|nr:kinase-like protein [Aspergillus campestris IBT 28561]PKY06200.1 kinase-like protein [Aspergillus campestris IBT 28561]
MKQPVEEENTPYYDSRLFYPARLGDVLTSRYQLAAKLGYRSNSTVWLARDLDREKYVALKINASFAQRRDTVEAELDTLRIISEANPRHIGYPFVRHLLDSFQLEYESTKCLVLVFEPLREPLWLYRQRFTGDTIPSDVLRIMLQMILHGLDYLHSECHVIHTDLKPDNIMVKLEDPSILEESAKDEYEHPLPQKTNLHGRTVYLSRNNYGLPRKTTGIIQITDFDLSVSGDQPHDGCIQAEIYRAPEVILDAGFSYSADIWNLGVMLWDVLEGKKLFKDIDPVHVHEYNELNHLARITALLGPPPKELLDKGKRTPCFYKAGALNGPTVEPTNFNFENLLTTVRGEDKRMFIEFVKRMLRWRPEERSTARELLQDPWLFTESED